MPRRPKFTKQYKPVHFGDLPDSRTVEGRRLAARRAAETCPYNQWNKENPPPQECGLIGLLWVLFKLPWFLCVMAYRAVRRSNTSTRGMGSSASQRPAR
jgi:hypothetical protein